MNENLKIIISIIIAILIIEFMFSFCNNVQVISF